MGRASTLPVHPRAMILAMLRRGKKPMTAYGILQKLHAKGVNSAPIVYRALAELEKKGIVHKIQSIGSYIACDCSADHHHPLSVLTVCHGCKNVAELHDHSVIHHLEKLRQMSVNLSRVAVIELPITCQQCAA